MVERAHRCTAAGAQVGASAAAGAQRCTALWLSGRVGATLQWRVHEAQRCTTQRGGLSLLSVWAQGLSPRGRRERRGAQRCTTEWGAHAPGGGGPAARRGLHHAEGGSAPRQGSARGE